MEPVFIDGDDSLKRLPGHLLDQIKKNLKPSPKQVLQCSRKYVNIHLNRGKIDLTTTGPTAKTAPPRHLKIDQFLIPDTQEILDTAIYAYGRRKERGKILVVKQHEGTSFNSGKAAIIIAKNAHKNPNAPANVACMRWVVWHPDEPSRELVFHRRLDTGKGTPPAGMVAPPQSDDLSASHIEPMKTEDAVLNTSASIPITLQVDTMPRQTSATDCKELNPRASISPDNDVSKEQVESHASCTPQQAAKRPYSFSEAQNTIAEQWQPPFQRQKLDPDTQIQPLTNISQHASHSIRQSTNLEAPDANNISYSDRSPQKLNTHTASPSLVNTRPPGTIVQDIGFIFHNPLRQDNTRAVHLRHCNSASKFADEAACAMIDARVLSIRVRNMEVTRIMRRNHIDFERMLGTLHQHVREGRLDVLVSSFEDGDEGLGSF